MFTRGAASCIGGIMISTSFAVRKAIVRVLAIAGACAALAACQTTETRDQQLARICADPASLRSDSFYFAECVAYKKPTPEQRRQIYMRTAPMS